MIRQTVEGCERYFLGIKTTDGVVTRYKAFPVRCHSWDCPVCARIKADQYKVRIKPLFDAGELWMYTFTYFHNAPPVEVWKRYSQAWNRFRTAANKRFGDIKYVRILEHHKKSPYPHLHVLMDRNLPATWINKELLSAGFGYQAEVHKCTGLEAALYVSKYLTKGWKDEECKKIRKALKLRIISFSAGVCVRGATGLDWSIVARAVAGDEVVNAILTDVTWSHARPPELTRHREIDAMEEWTFFIPEGGMDADEITSIVPIP